MGFDFSGRFLRTLGGFGARPGSFRGLGGLATAPRGGLVTAERVNARVQREALGTERLLDAFFAPRPEDGDGHVDAPVAQAWHQLGERSFGAALAERVDHRQRVE